MEVPISRRNLIRFISLLLVVLVLSKYGNAGKELQHGRNVPTRRLPYHAFACEGSVLHLDCSGDGGVIRVMRATYGRLSLAICNDRTVANAMDWNTICMSRRSRRKVRHLCQSKTFCTIPASNDVFGDACPGTPKYVQVEYRCR
ncbi:L-rhamnose-binding lectin ELEL-1 [Lingula anatina]|uniref:L-rhamnose-binding lectin ELEL-1 n=1 Tax=Lingula anatina TaxID=7574 RepID=A0A1S3HSG7_LINAN|nr:L-rhamnose-binding lectin ELEL-1 [Lingula anatina]|eukprot:XP_013388491.1 L-rhamnose-binding lectin ELEL-1 [Lingula anatina]